MGFLDRLLGREDRDPYPPQPRPAANRPGSDEAAIERYRYLLRTAPPDAIEQAHAEAFAQLTPDQRRQVLQGLSGDVPPQERATSDDPRALARMATRAEMRRPGTLEQRFAGMGGGVGLGGVMATSLLGSVAAAFVGTAITDAFFDLSDGPGDETAEAGGDADGSEAGGPDGGGDAYAADDSAGGWGDGGDFGGGDFGGDF
jgi:hypothetical protein